MKKNYLKHGMLIGLSAVILAGCGGSDDDDELDAEVTAPEDNTGEIATEDATVPEVEPEPDEETPEPEDIPEEDDISEPDEPAEEDTDTDSEESAEAEDDNDSAGDSGRIADGADLETVELERVVDGDTVHVTDSDGEPLELRLLLIDTPETVHPNEPVQPFGPEASERLDEFLTSHSPLYIEYDEGDRQDQYGRELVYLYAEDSLGNVINVQEVLLEEGLARVGYVYEQTRHLQQFEMREASARDDGLGIWSVPGYVNEAGEGFNMGSDSESEDAPDDNAPADGSELSVEEYGQDPQFDFENCDELTAEFPNGVTSDHPAYDQSLDGDLDGHACEAA